MNSAAGSLKISKRSFFTSVGIIAALMLVAYLLTLFVPVGHYDYANYDGKLEIVAGSYSSSSETGGYPIWKLLTAPFEVFASPDALTVIVIMIFILLIGGSFTVMETSGLIRAMIAKIALKMQNKKKLFIIVLSLFFMMLGAFFGIMEEIVPMIPLVIGLCYMLGWDSLMGLGLTLLSACFGFAAAISNPFSIGIAQSLAGLEQFSGAPLRILFFFVIYVLLAFFLLRHAKKIEADPCSSPVYTEDLDPKKAYTVSKEELAAAAQYKKSPIILTVICLILLFCFLFAAPPLGLSDYSMLLIALVFIIVSTLSSLLGGFTLKSVLKAFIKGAANIAPGILLIPLAMSVKFMIADSGIMDTLLWYMTNVISENPLVNIMLIYCIVLLMNFFVGSASAKAFLLIPILIPLADLTGITRQTTILAFSMGDGFSNVIYPTNPMLLIALGLTAVSYPKWFKWTFKLQAAVVFISMVFLMAALGIGYA